MGNIVIFLYVFLLLMILWDWFLKLEKFLIWCCVFVFILEYDFLSYVLGVYFYFRLIIDL